MMKKPLNSLVARLPRRGQVMVLACVALLVLALMLSMSFSISNAIHERVRLQSSADSAAYSAATVAARAMNVTAYTNRAIAAVLVTQMSVHAWMAIASQTFMIHVDAAMNHETMSGQEMGMCCSCPWGACCIVIHCFHSKVDDLVAIYHGVMAIVYLAKVMGKESDFNDAVEALNQATIDLHKLQVDTVKTAKNEVSMQGTVLDSLLKKNAPHATYSTAVLQMNGGEFACALEGTSFDGDCAKVYGSNPGVSSPGDRSTVMQNAANAARLPFHSCPDCSNSSHDDFKPDADHLKSFISMGSNSETPSFTINAYVNDMTFAPMFSNGAEAKTVGAQSMGTMSSSRYCCSASMPLFSTAWSDDSGGLHLIPHTTSHDKFKGYQREDVCDDGACFINFRANSDKDIDFNQPSMYASVSQDLGKMRSGKRGEWEINKDGKVRVEYGNGVAADIDIKPRGNGVAVSKAKVYYHQLKHWQFQPNLFDAFWRAKLHPFKRQEMQKVLGAAGDAEGAALIGAGGPVEGDDK